jgi:carbamoyltransferase
MSAPEEFRNSRIRERIRRFLSPRIGVLYHYPPRPLKLPKPYARLPESPPRLSIVTPSFGQAQYVERTLRSVLDQGYPQLEYVVQDGGSKDGTVEVLKRYAPSLKHWESAKDNGQAHAINLAFRHTGGEIMAYLNSDDLLLPGALAYVARYFTRHPEVDAVYGHRVLIDEYDREVGRWVLPPHQNEVLSWADYVPQETLFWRRRIWDKAGGTIDESFRFAMDWDLILRFRDAGARFVRLPRFLGAFRVHAQQKTSAEIAQVGALEMDRLRTRCHGRSVDWREINRGKLRYVMMHVLYDKAYRALGLG